MLAGIRGIIADMDGVLWRGDEPLLGAARFFQEISIPYVFATNNSSQTVEHYRNKLQKMGVPAEAEQIVTSSIATAAYLAEHYPAGTTVYMIGETGLRTALQSHGFTLVKDLQPTLVVAGLDRGLSYEKIARAANYIRAGAMFIGTNSDLTYPIPRGLAPGAGSVQAAIQAACGIAPQVIGKPERPMFDIGMQRLGTLPEETLMIGDRLETDIWGGHTFGLKTAMVLSGVSTEADIMKSSIQPDVVVHDLGALLELMRRLV
jgi:4-nitrophenyl phosphatase